MSIAYELVSDNTVTLETTEPPNPYQVIFPEPYDRAVFYTGLCDRGSIQASFPMFDNKLFHQKIEQRDNQFIGCLVMVCDFLHCYLKGAKDNSHNIEKTIAHSGGGAPEYVALVHALYSSMDLITGSRLRRMIRRWVGF